MDKLLRAHVRHPTEIAAATGQTEHHGYDRSQPATFRYGMLLLHDSNARSECLLRKNRHNRTDIFCLIVKVCHSTLLSPRT